MQAEAFGDRTGVPLGLHPSGPYDYSRSPLPPDRRTLYGIGALSRAERRCIIIQLGRQLHLTSR
jgi:hypothetical protein